MFKANDIVNMANKQVAALFAKSEYMLPNVAPAYDIFLFLTQGPTF